MITPDDKDWTWVLERPCPECGFDASSPHRRDLADLVRANAADWERLSAAGALTTVRPDEQTWSPLEYACHVRDVYARFDQRMASIQAEDDPLFENWDQDATATDDGYARQDRPSVVEALSANAAAIAARMDRFTDDEWPRVGRRSDGASFTLESLSRYLVHDPVHHIWDVGGVTSERG